MKKTTFLLLIILFSISGFSQALIQGFETPTTPSGLPLNWVNFESGAASESWFTDTSAPHTGTKSALLYGENIGVGVSAKYYIATPLVTIPVNGQLRFWVKTSLQGNQGGVFKVKVASGALTSNQTNEAAYTTLQTYTESQLSTNVAPAPIVYEEQVINFPVASYPANTQVYIAFVSEVTQASQFQGDDFYLDDVLVVSRCLEPTTLAAGTFTATSAVLSWTNPNPIIGAGLNTCNQWEIEIIPTTQLAPTGAGILVNTNPYTATTLTAAPFAPLQPLTQYKYYVRSICLFSGSIWAGPFTFTTAPGLPVCGGNFVDPGGLSNYGNFANSTVRICPVTTGDLVTVTFSQFATELDFDILKVYNGNTVSPANLLGTYSGTLTGNALPGPFTSSASNGCLTFVFTSDDSTVAAGWLANVTCAPVPTCTRPSALTTSTVTINSVSLAWTQPLNPNGTRATAWQYLALPCGTAAPTASTVGWLSAPTNPFIATGLIPGKCYDFYVRASCSSTDTSAWSLPKSASTLPGCGGFFTDAGGTIANYANSSNITNTICPINTGDQVTVTFTSFSTQLSTDLLKIYDGNSVATGTLLGTFSGTTIPGPITASGPTGCLTFVFTSNATTNSTGWESNITCLPAPTCTKPKTLTVTQITQSTALLGWTQLANPDGSSASAWQVLALPCGSPAPTAASIGWLNANSNPFYITGLNSATCYEYYVRAVCSPTDSSFIVGPKSFNTLIANDECAGAIEIPVNQNTNCLQTTFGSLTFATASLVTNSCGTTASADDNDDVWFKFTATSTSHYITILGPNYTAEPFNINYALYTGTCGVLTQFGGCIVNNDNLATGLTVGRTYYVRVYSEGTTAVTTTFELCVGTNVGTCATALPLCAITPIIIPNNVGVPTLPNPVSPYSTTSTVVGCLFTAPSPTFYYLQIPTSGNYNFFLEQNTSSAFNGTGIDVDFVAWGPFATNAAACAGITTANAPPTGPSLGCSYSAAATENFGINNAIAGEVYVIMITNFNGRKGFVRITQTQGPIPLFCCPFGNFTYPKTFYCQNEANPSPTLISNAVAGIYSSTAGLSLNPTTGLIDLAASTPGTYIIHNTVAPSGTCPSDDDTWTITITAPPTSIGITYSAPSFCKLNSTLQNISQTGSTGGNYTVAPAVGLSLNTTTGTFTPSTSTVGTYLVSYNLPQLGGCPGAISTTQVTITAVPVATFIYNSATYCKTGTNPVLSYTGGGVAGVYSSTAGLTLDPTTGAINLATSTIGSYVITNTIAASGGCGVVTATFSITITSPSIATFSYTSSPYCSTSSNPSPTFSGGGVSGVFTSTSGLSINTATGEINLASSTVGTYTVTNTIAATGGCAVVLATAQVTITAVPVAAFIYDSATYCKTGTNPVLSYTGGGVAGVYSSTAGLTLDPTTGAINLATSTIGSYVITNTIAASGGCGVVTATFSITITSPSIATFSYTSSPYCSTSSNPSPTFSGGGVSGVFTSTSGLSINTATGVINLASSTAGTYTVTNTIAATGGCAAVVATAQVTITAVPSATISYGNSFYCYDNVGLQPVILIGTSGGAYSVTPTGLTLSSTSGAINAGTSQGGVYTITYTIAASGGCSQLVTTATVTIIPEVNVELRAECLASNFTITALPVAGSFDPLTATYEWSGPNGYTFGPTPSPSIVVTEPGTYTSTVTYDGCTHVNTHLVNSTTCTMQKGISPNGDGDNEEFLLADVKSLSIFNRYGSKVYNHGLNYTNQWHGQTNAGDALPDGTYYYVVTRTSGETITGWIYINK